MSSSSDEDVLDGEYWEVRSPFLVVQVPEQIRLYGGSRKRLTLERCTALKGRLPRLG